MFCAKYREKYLPECTAISNWCHSDVWNLKFCPRNPHVNTFVGTFKLSELYKSKFSESHFLSSTSFFICVNDKNMVKMQLF